MNQTPRISQHSTHQSVQHPDQLDLDAPNRDGDEELVILLDENLTPCGTHAKATVHSTKTPLHLAFSCHVTRADGAVLLTRRALSKKTWPGVWTNSFCGHPAPGEDPTQAVHRRAKAELGTTISQIRLELPNFQYRAVDDSGIVENELCPVYTAQIDSELAPDPCEVMAWEWVFPSHVKRALQATPFVFSPWLAEEAAAMDLYNH